MYEVKLRLEYYDMVFHFKYYSKAADFIDTALRHGNGVIATIEFVEDDQWRK